LIKSRDWIKYDKAFSEKPVSLPVYTGLSEADVEYITIAVKVVIKTAQF
jgi:hypothetical protein